MQSEAKIQVRDTSTKLYSIPYAHGSRDQIKTCESHGNDGNTDTANVMERTLEAYLHMLEMYSHKDK